MQLAHMTLNTGHRAATPRSAVADFAVERLLPLARAGGGALPGLAGWHLALLQFSQPGAAYLQLAERPGMSRYPLIMGFACWIEAVSQPVWSTLLAAYDAQRSELWRSALWMDPPQRPPGTPWVAIWLTRHASRLPEADIQAIRDIKRSLAWALIERG